MLIVMSPLLQRRELLNMTMNANIFSIEMRCAFSIRFGDDNVSLFDSRSNLCFADPFLECERSIPGGQIEEELVEVLHSGLGARADIFGLAVRSDRDHLMKTVGMPYRSECNLRRSVKLWLQAPRTEDFARFEEHPEEVVPFSDAEVAPLSFEKCKRLFRVDLVGRTINAQRSRNSSVGVCLESQRCNNRNIRPMANLLTQYQDQPGMPYAGSTSLPLGIN